jgi:Uma2 family endonuclease
MDPEHGSATVKRMDSAVASASRQPFVRLVPEPPDVEDGWVLAEEDMPESNLHRDIVDLLRLILLAFVVRSGRDALVAANLACQWNVVKRSLGVDPDIALIEPAPPEGAQVKSLLTWRAGHVPPRFAIEVVSETNPAKDYVDAPAKFARLGTRELVIFDPTLIGPRVRGGPHALQVWRRDEQRGRMTRVYAGEGPAFSEELAAWLVVTREHGQGRQSLPRDVRQSLPRDVRQSLPRDVRQSLPRLRIADDPEGRSLWRTEAEQAEQQAVRGLRAAVEDVCEMCGIALDAAKRGQIEGLDVAGLEALRGRIKKERGWPAGG